MLLSMLYHPILARPCGAQRSYPQTDLSMLTSAIAIKYVIYVYDNNCIDGKTVPYYLPTMSVYTICQQKF